LLDFAEVEYTEVDPSLAISCTKPPEEKRNTENVYEKFRPKLFNSGEIRISSVG
jgi:hypothetical protein